MRFGCRFVALASVAADLLFSNVAFSEPRSEIDSAQLKRSYDANQWHMQRFMSEYLLQEERLGSDPDNHRLRSRLDTLKYQIDVLTRENERILNTLDEMEKERTNESRYKKSQP